MASRVHLNEDTENDESMMEPGIDDESEIAENESTEDQSNVSLKNTFFLFSEASQRLQYFSIEFSYRIVR